MNEPREALMASDDLLAKGAICDNCGGRGVVPDADEVDVCVCQDCDGTGRVSDE